jgi:hypothetical protein
LDLHTAGIIITLTSTNASIITAGTPRVASTSVSGPGTGIPVTTTTSWLSVPGVGVGASTCTY